MTPATVSSTAPAATPASAAATAANAASRRLGALFAGVMASLGGLAMTSAFRIEDLLRPVGAAAAVAVAVSMVVTGVLSTRLAVAVVAAVGALVPTAAVACGGGLGDVSTGLVDGWRRILETAGLAPPDALLLVVPFALTAAAAFLGAEIAQRTSSAAAPAIPSLVVFGIGLAFGFDGRLPPAWLAVAWAALAAVVVGLRARRPSVRPAAPLAPAAGTNGSGATVLRAPRRSFVSATITVLVVALPAAGAAHAVAPRLPGLDGRDRVSLRDHFAQQDDDVEHRDPLVLMTELRAGEDTLQFSADTSARVERWRVAALDTYDGVSWEYTGHFRPAGEELQPPVTEPADDADEADAVRITQKVTRGAWVGPWLPVADRAVEVDVDDVEFDPSAGVLRTADGGAPPKTYTVESVVPVPDGALLADAEAAQDEEAQAALQLPDKIPDELVAAAEEAIAGTGSAYAQAAAIERYLTSSDVPVPFQLADDAPGGTNAYNIACFVAAEASDDKPECAGRLGTREQFATVFALMARHVGLPTRVVVGFDGSVDAGGSHDITAHAATAWTEVKFQGVGWVAFNPLPNADTVTETAPAVPTGGQSEETTPTTMPPDSETAATAADAGPSDDAESDSGTGVALWVAVAGAVVLVAAMVPGVVRRRRRSRRRHGPTPSDRIVGAWNNAVDQLVAAGLAVTRDRSVTDVVVAGQAVVQPGAAEPLGPLGRLTNVARFAPAAPDAGAADHAWELSDRFAAECRKTRTLPQRLRHYFRLRS